jgi:hypothetical protein
MLIDQGTLVRIAAGSVTLAFHPRLREDAVVPGHHESQ